jgi:hypothetical protein
MIGGECCCVEVYQQRGKAGELTEWLGWKPHW